MSINSKSQTVPRSTSMKEQTQRSTTDVATGEYKLVAEGDVLSSSGRYDCHAFFVHCPTHNKVLITKRDRLRWLPFIEMPPNRSWKDGCMIGFCLVLSGSDKAKAKEMMRCPPYQSYKCLQLLRLQVPQTRSFLKRTIYYFKVKPSAGDFRCCQSVSPNMEWYSLANVRVGRVPHLWGPELVQCCSLIGDDVPQKICEYSLDEAYMYVPRDPPRNLEEDMLKSLHITQCDVERLYADFLEHCFPSLYQTLDSFRVYMSKYKFERNGARSQRLFSAMNISRNGYLSFHELLLGLACLEPTARHGEFRVKFLFRYYDTNHAGSLNVDKLKVMVADMFPGEQLNAKLEETINAFGSTSAMGQFNVQEKDFAKAIGSHRLRGTSSLVRVPKSIFSVISRSLAMKFLRRVDGKTVLSKAVPSRAHKGVCKACRDRKYQLASHLVSVNINGTMKSTPLGKVEKDPGNTLGKGFTAQQYSAEIIFKPYSAANLILRMIRLFATNKGTVEQPLGLMQNRKPHFWRLLLQLYSEVCALLAEELKCQRVYSPTYIIGDVHGNIEDLLSMERTIWPTAPCLGANYIFLGDYVDRGQWGLECALYIASLKVICPNRITMLRGNHEIRSLQRHYSYLKECITKYGDSFGLKIFELTNRIFDKLPVCALVDDAIYCAHGGVPHEMISPEKIMEMKKDIREPGEESLVAWEILWSDPCTQQEFLDSCDIREVNPDTTNGFVFNTKRGTAFKFNEQGASYFLRGNLLTHIIRAHQVAIPGYEFHFINMCVTIFSSSHYSGNDNECGLILADNQRLRVLIIDTMNNASATD